MLQTEESRAEQSQVAAKICKEHEISVQVLRPSEARKRGIMRVIPAYAPGESNRRRASILKGLEQLLKINPQLDLYERLQSQIKSDSQWEL